MGHDKEITSGYWWVEVGGTVWDTVADAEEIRDELLKIVYGIWDHIKNGGDHGADTLALEWVGFLPGKRESRRVLGDYVLKEQDLLAGRVFPDAVGYGGWHIDSHPPERFRCIAAKTEESEDLPVHLPGLYTIPYRSLYARGVENLLLGGRIISATHRAFASTRVMGTCAVLAQAAGTAAAWAAERGVTPRELGADVAALLRCLRRQYAPEMPVEQLRAIGLTVGSDMPFCVSGGTALAEGRGERLTALPALPDCWIVLCKPEFGIPTPALFTLADAGTPKNRPDIDGMIRALSAEDLNGVAARLCNVFEEFLPEEYHEVFHIKNRLLELGALNAAMSGSGPTVFGIFREKTAAKAAETALKQCYPQTYLAKPVGELV